VARVPGSYARKRRSFTLKSGTKAQAKISLTPECFCRNPDFYTVNGVR
jgi:hypothetical protein